MKKIFYGAAAALLLVGAASCGDSAKDDKSEVFSPEATDSLTISFADLAGYSFANEINSAMQRDSSITKEAFLRGMQYAMAADTTQAYLYGVNLGLQMQGQLAQYRKMGVNIDKSKWLDAFKKAFLADSVPGPMEMTAYQQDFQKWNDSLRNAKRSFDIAAIENTPEAQANLQEAKKYISDLKKKDPSVKETKSGLVYKIENEGTGDKVATNGRVVLNCKVKALKGQNPPSIPGNPMPVSQFNNGLKEGVAMLGKGGKATFYVPGRLAYEHDMAQRMGLEPNTLFIYEVEVVDIPDAAAPQQQAMPGMPAVGAAPVKAAPTSGSAAEKVAK